jgi:hypothetical protein
MESIHIRDLLNSCRGFVQQSLHSWHGDRAFIEFAHRTVGAYVQRTWFSDARPSHAKIAEALFKSLKTSRTIGGIYDYAAIEWPYHLDKSADCLELDKVMGFHLGQHAVGRSCAALPPGCNRRGGRSGLFLAARFGLVRYMAALVACGENPNMRDEVGETPLLWAIANRQENAEEWLLEQGVDPNTRDVRLRTALHLAALQGNRKPSAVFLVVEQVPPWCLSMAKHHCTLP